MPELFVESRSSSERGAHVGKAHAYRQFPRQLGGALNRPSAVPAEQIHASDSMGSPLALGSYCDFASCLS